jgi:toxin ParE1/3/4
VSRPVILRPDAEADLQTTFNELEAVQSGLGLRFIARVREVLERIEALPELHGVVWQDVRAVRLKTFRYVVYYSAFPDRVEILAVLHGSRNPSAWKSRVE